MPPIENFNASETKVDDDVTKESDESGVEERDIDEVRKENRNIAAEIAALLAEDDFDTDDDEAFAKESDDKLMDKEDDNIAPLAPIR